MTDFLIIAAIFTFLMLVTAHRGIMWLVFAALLSPLLYGGYVLLASLSQYGAGAVAAVLFLLLLLWGRENRHRAG